MATDIISFPDPAPASAAAYVAAEDIHEQLPDGRVLQIARKGQLVPFTEALRLGLVKAAPADPTFETKPAPPPTPVVYHGAPPVNKAPAGPAPFGAERMAATAAEGQAAARAEAKAKAAAEAEAQATSDAAAK